MFGAINYGQPLRRHLNFPQNMQNLQNELGQAGVGYHPGEQASTLSSYEGPHPDVDLPRFEAGASTGVPLPDGLCHGYGQGLPDMVHQPRHYARYVIEPVTFIGANKLPFDVGNVIKYVCRYDAKNGIEDLEKAKRYVEIVIERVKREARIDNGERAETVWSEII